MDKIAPMLQGLTREVKNSNTVVYYIVQKHGQHRSYVPQGK